jgi:GNAT superfamily N-acetyltransferase
VTSYTPFVDLALSRRLEQAEARGGVAFVEARMAIDPDAGAAWIERHGAYAMFDGVGSPVTQTFALGLDGPVNADDLAALETFFQERGADVCHEVSPLVGVEVYATLTSRGYAPVELTSVMFQPLRGQIGDSPQRLSDRSGDSPLQKTGGDCPRSQSPPLRVRQISVDEADMFGRVTAHGWSESAELRVFLEGFGRAIASRPNSPCFVAELDGLPIGTGVLTVWNGVALLAGASTIPAYRRQGAQHALLDARLRFATEHGCDIAMMCAAPGSASQRNAERNGFRIAYTRVKWQLRRAP